MENVRCRCDKIVAQLDGQKVVIKCRHCKRAVIISLDPRPGTKQLLVEYQDDVRLEALPAKG